MTKKNHKSFFFFFGSSEVIQCICEEQMFASLTCEQKEFLYVLKKPFGPGHKTEPNDTFSESNRFGSWVQLTDLMNQTQEFHWRIFNQWIQAHDFSLTKRIHFVEFN